MSEPLTQEEEQVALSALWAYKLETQQYLRGYGTDETHDACCLAAATRAAMRAERQQALADRLRECESAIAKLEAQ